GQACVDAGEGSVRFRGRSIGRAKTPCSPSVDQVAPPYLSRLDLHGMITVTAGSLQDAECPPLPLPLRPLAVPWLRAPVADSDVKSPGSWRAAVVRSPCSISTLPVPRKPFRSAVKPA